MENQQQKSGFQEIILALQHYWAEQRCLILQPYDLPMGAGTFHPATFFGVLRPGNWRVAYAQACRRPGDGRYGKHPNRLQHYYQLQALLKPAPDNAQELYLKSLAVLGIKLAEHEIRFVDDNWESPTLGAYGVGWEVWLDGLEVSQFTYFQEAGGLTCDPAVEITYGLERLAMHLQDVDNINELAWCAGGRKYGEVFEENEREQSAYNFEYANCDVLARQYADCEAACRELLETGQPLVRPAYEQIILASHAFNLLDARGGISVIQRQDYILRTRKMARAVARAYRDTFGDAGGEE